MFTKKPDMGYDPRLKAAAIEIKAIFDKHGIGGAINLVSDTHAEMLIHFPKWSLIQMEGKGIRLRMKSKEEARSMASLHCLLALRDGTALFFDQLYNSAETLLEQLKKQGTQIDHKPFHNFKPDWGSES